MLSLFSSRWNWDFPTPSPAGKCAPTHLVLGGGHTRLREMRWGVPIPTRGQTLWYAWYICNFPRQLVASCHQCQRCRRQNCSRYQCHCCSKKTTISGCLQLKLPTEKKKIRISVNCYTIVILSATAVLIIRAPGFHEQSLKSKIL